MKNSALIFIIVFCLMMLLQLSLMNASNQSSSGTMTSVEQQIHEESMVQ